MYIVFKHFRNINVTVFLGNGTVNMDPELGEIVQLSGDQRTNVREFFVDQEICHEDQIVIHGG